MATLLIVAPVFALIAAGYVAVVFRFTSESAHKGISEFAFSIAIPALLFRTVVLADFSGSSAFGVWTSYYGAAAFVWIASLLLSSFRRQARQDAIVVAMGSTYGNVAMLGIPLTLAALGSQAAGTMALILSVNTPLFWLFGTLQMAVADRKPAGSLATPILRSFLDIARNPIMLALGLGFLWRATGLGLHPIADKTVELLAQAGPPTALIALGISLRRFEIRGERLSMVMMCALKLLVMPAVAWILAFYLVGLPPMAAAVVVLFAAMPPGANAYIFAAQHRRLENSVSGAVALGTMVAAATLPAVVTLVSAVR